MVIQEFLCPGTEILFEPLMWCKLRISKDIEFSFKLGVASLYFADFQRSTALKTSPKTGECCASFSP